MGTALKTWELENSIALVDPIKDALYSYSKDAQKAIDDAHPWRADSHYFTGVRISAVALLKMVMHARSGGSLEVMGLMLGKIEAHTFVVTDAFRLPVEGTETRVNAQDEANEYMVEFLQRARDQGQMDNAVGWYHSHPGYGCWLSGIDVNTQKTQQQFQDPFCAIVIDPDRTVSAGKVEIGAFRTYSDQYIEGKEKSAGPKPVGGGTDSDGFQTIPLGKIEDFGAHAAHYYSLDISHYKSSLDAKILEALWNKYWVQTLSSSPLISNRDYGTEYVVPAEYSIIQNVATRMGTALSAAAGRTYAVIQSSNLYPTSGSTTDYAYGRHIKDPSLNTVRGYTIEFGFGNTASSCPFYPTQAQHTANLKEIEAGFMEFVLAAAANGLGN